MNFELQNINGTIVPDKKIKCGHRYRNIKKPYIKFMVITRMGVKYRKHDIAFLTSDMNFYYTSLNFLQHIHYISNSHIEKINQIFKNFEITENTEIVIQDTVDTFCPIVIYFNILRPYIKFMITTISLVKMIKRIYYKHPSISKRVANKKGSVTSKNISMYVGKAWNKIIELDTCPWITKSVNDNLKLLSEKDARQQIRTRLCLYYMLIRRYFMNNNVKCMNRNQKNTII